MKTVLILLITMPVLAFGTPGPGSIFDEYIGQYEVVSEPIIRNDRAKSCNRYFFKDLTGIEILKQSSWDKQSHMIKFHFDANGAIGWMGHPIEDYHEVNDELKDYGIETSTSVRSRTVIGGVSNVINHNTFGPNKLMLEQHNVRITKEDKGFLFKMYESLTTDGADHSCSYRVKLRAK